MKNERSSTKFNKHLCETIPNNSWIGLINLKAISYHHRATKSGNQQQDQQKHHPEAMQTNWLFAALWKNSPVPTQNMYECLFNSKRANLHR